MRKLRNADEGVWGGLLAGWACLTLAAVIVYSMTTRPNILLWDIIGLMLITAMAGGAFAFMNQSRNNQPFLTGCEPEFNWQKFGWMLMRSCSLRMSC